jgi:hypothetical protein
VDAEGAHTFFDADDVVTEEAEDDGRVGDTVAEDADIVPDDMDADGNTAFKENFTFPFRSRPIHITLSFCPRTTASVT